VEKTDLRLGRVTEFDSTGVGYLRDAQQPLREYLFAARQVVQLPEGPRGIEADSLVWYQLAANGQVTFVLPASGLLGLVEHVGQSQSATVAEVEYANLSR
jgi:hypothetical protein